jgi:hypothetical protein
VIYSIISLILNIIFSTNIAECTPPEQHIEDAHDILYNNYKTYANFKEYMNSEVINNTPLILNKYEPLSMTYLRTSLYTLHRIHDSFPDKPEDTEIMSNQFYDNMLLFDKNIVYNILENMAIINIEKNNELIYSTIADFLCIEKEKTGFNFTDFEIRDIRLMNNGFSTPPTILEIAIPNYKIPMDLKNPCILPQQPIDFPVVLQMLFQDIETKIGIYQNYYGVHDLPDSTMKKIISDTAKTYNNNPEYWQAYHNTHDDSMRIWIQGHIIENIQDYYLEKPYISKLQMQVYQNTSYYFLNLDNENFKNSLETKSISAELVMKIFKIHQLQWQKEKISPLYARLIKQSIII